MEPRHREKQATGLPNSHFEGNINEMFRRNRDKYRNRSNFLGSRFRSGDSLVLGTEVGSLGDERLLALRERLTCRRTVTRTVLGLNLNSVADVLYAARSGC